MAAPMASNSLSLNVFEAVATSASVAGVDSTNTSKYRCSSRAIGAVAPAGARGSQGAAFISAGLWRLQRRPGLPRPGSGR
jgi:hypothetical protein